MPRDLFEERGIKIDQPRDLFQERGIETPSMKKNKLKELLGANRSPLDTVRDLGQGALTGLGEGGQLIARALTGGYAPKVDFDKALGFVGSPNKSTSGEAEKMIGSFLPYMEFGGGATLKGIDATKGAVSKGIDYLQPGKQAEQFRSTLGSGTSSENIENLGKRLQFAKKSATEESLIPKRELYSQEGKSNIYNVSQNELPEGNLNKLSEIINPQEEFSVSQKDALSKALKDYRKTGKIESFLNKSEDIFSIPELKESHADKIEDILSMPTKRDSLYLSDKDVNSFYGKKGNLKELHDAYVKKPILNNYDALQSALKKQQRILDKRLKSGTITDLGESKLDQLNENIKNLDKDKENFMNTLPQELKNLENEFRQKYASGVGKYADAGEGAKNIIRKLYKGKWQEVTPNQIGRVFSRPTTEVKEILKEIGPSGSKNILYNALQKVPVGDAEGLANTLLDLKRTKGYDQFITNDMEDWAQKTLTQVKRSKMIKNALGSLGGAGAGYAAFGPAGAAIGLGAPFAKQGLQKVGHYLKR